MIGTLFTLLVVAFIASAINDMTLSNLTIGIGAVLATVIIGGFVVLMEIMENIGL